MIFVLSLLAAALYSISSAALSRALKLRRAPEAVPLSPDPATELIPESMSQAQRRKLTLICATAAVVIHGWLIINQTGLPHSLMLPLATSISATTLTIVLIHIALCMRQPADYLGLAVYPLAALSLLVTQASGLGTPISSHSIQIHVLLSLVSYSVLALAAAQAVLVAAQRHYLSTHKPNGIVRSLPPLDTTEQLLFTLLTVGFVLLSLALGSGFIYLEDMFDQRLVHKTALSCIGWGIFGILLFGRWRYGWRGKKAVHWTLGGYATLILAFFGTKAIIEVVLG